MSDLNNERAYEDCYERFCLLLDECEEFKDDVMYWVYSHENSWSDKEYGWNESHEKEAFEELWEYDSEGCYYDLRKTLDDFIINERKKIEVNKCSG